MRKHSIGCLDPDPEDLKRAKMKREKKRILTDSQLVTLTKKNY
jgi:hypothetical protein